MSSDNTQPPFFGPEHAVYPAVDEFVRIDVDRDASGVYGGWLQQLAQNNPPRFRDRVRVYIFDPNGLDLGPGYYNARLESAYLGILAPTMLPLYATYCCPATSFSSSSSSSSSSEG